MSHPSKFLLVIMTVVVTVSIAVTFWKLMIIKDFEIVDDVEVESEEVAEEI